VTRPRTTWVLLAVLFALVSLDLGLRAVLVVDDAPVPEWATVPRGQVDGVVLTRQEVVVRLARDDDGLWTVIEPFSDRADPAAVVALLDAVTRGGLLEARVEDDPELHDTYGLAGIDPIRVALTGGEEVLAELYIGRDGPGRTTFVRLPGADDVYRARLGGRSVADRPPGAWRDPTLLAVAPDDVLALTVRGRAELSFVRASGLDGAGGWLLEGRPDLPLDLPSVEALVAAFAELKALEVLPAPPAELETPDLVVDVVLASGTETFRFSALRGQAFGMRERDGRAFRVRFELLSALARPVATWRDRTLLRVDPERLTELVLRDAGGEAVLYREGGEWQARSVGVDVDPALVAQAARFLATLAVEGWAVVPPESAGFPGAESVVLRGDGVRVIEIGGRVPERPPGREALFVRMADAPDQVGAIPARTWSALLRAWGR
jgi:hypothetical protein